MERRVLVCKSWHVLAFLTLLGLPVVAFGGLGEWTSAGPEGATSWSIQIDPQAPMTLYVAAQGVWKSTDGGSSWSCASQGMAYKITRAIAVDPVNQGTVYAGTYGAGVYKTIDGGSSWSEVNAGLTGDRVTALAVHPTTTSTIFVGLCPGGVFRSLDGGALWVSVNNGIGADESVIEFEIDPTAPETVFAGTSRGLFKSTDGGVSWEDLGDLLPNYAVQAVSVDPTNSATVFVGLEWGGIYKSVDGGVSWQDSSSGLTVLNVESIVVDPLTATTVFAVTEGGGIFKSVDGGATWVAKNDGLSFLAGSDLCLSPIDSDTIFLATQGAGIYKTTDGASTWVSANTGFHAAWVDALVSIPGVPGSIGAGGWNGVWLSTDGAGSWQSINGDLGDIAVGALAGDPVDENVMFAGTWSGLYRTEDGGSTWVRRDEGLTSLYFEMVATDPEVTDRLYVGVWDGLHVSDDGGESWSRPSTGPQGKRVLSMAFDPTNPSTMYVGAWGGVYRSDDGGESWTSSLDEERIWDLAIDPDATNTVYCCTYNGVFKTVDGGSSWTAAGNGLTEDYCWALVVDPFFHDTIFMGSGAGVFVSHDGAATWERFPGLDDFNIKDLVFDPSGDTLYAGGRGGGVAAYTFAGGGSCSLQCSASAPEETTVGATISLQGEAEASGCSGPPTYRWDFGDGSAAGSGQGPTHRYGVSGDYSWTMTATADEEICTVRGDITVAPFAPSWFVPAVAHAPGVGGTSWRTDIAVVAGDLGPVDLKLGFLPDGGGAERHRRCSLSVGQTLEWADVLVSLFDFANGEEAKGTVKVDADAPFFITARTFNQTSAGTFGQYIPALPAADSVNLLSSPWSKVVSGGEVGIIPHLKSNADFRSNVGVQNLGESAVDVTITLFGSGGAQIGSVLARTIQVGKFWQQNDIFLACGSDHADLAYALVEVQSQDGSAWFYGSVVDNATGDPTTIPTSQPLGGDALAGGIAHAPGAAGTTWRTDLAIINRGPAPGGYEIGFGAYDGGNVVSNKVRLESMATREWRDVLGIMFGFAPQDSIKGTLRFFDTPDLCVTARTYNQTSVGTFGQLMPAIRVSEGFGIGDVIVIPGLKNNGRFRSNVGALNLSAFPVAVTVSLFDAEGDQVGDTLSRSIGAFEYSQFDNVFWPTPETATLGTPW